MLFRSLAEACRSENEAAQHAAAAVRGRNTADRLHAVVDRMREYVRQLRLCVAGASQQLRECGEECTDLW